MSLFQFQTSMMALPLAGSNLYIDKVIQGELARLNTI